MCIETRRIFERSIRTWVSIRFDPRSSINSTPVARAHHSLALDLFASSSTVYWNFKATIAGSVRSVLQALDEVQLRVLLKSEVQLKVLLKSEARRRKVLSGPRARALPRNEVPRRREDRLRRKLLLTLPTRIWSRQPLLLWSEEVDRLVKPSLNT